MAKHYKYVNGKRLIVVNNYELGSDVIPEEVNLIPDITQADEGKVLMADENGEPKWTSIPSQLPTISGNNGKVLKVNSGATGVEWDDESTDLPSVSSTDNGDVLTVVEGQWAKATPSGGGEEYLVTYSINGETVTCDKSFADIKEAWEAGKKLVAKSQYGGSYGWEYYVLSENGGGMTNPFTKAIFTSVSYPNDSCKIRIIKHTAAAIIEVQKSIQ